MIAKIIALILGSYALFAQDTGSFTAAQYFEIVRPDLRPSHWPERVHFHPIELKAEEFESRSVWRLLITCSGRPLRSEDFRKGLLSFPLANAQKLSSPVYVETATSLSSANRHPKVTSPTLIETFFELSFQQESGGGLIIRNGIGGSILRPNVISEQNEREIIFVGDVDGFLANLLEPICGNETLQVILAPEPVS